MTPPAHNQPNLPARPIFRVGAGFLGAGLVTVAICLIFESGHTELGTILLLLTVGLQMLLVAATGYWWLPPQAQGMRT
jgi:hypothetical protein